MPVDMRDVKTYLVASLVLLLLALIVLLKSRMSTDTPIVSFFLHRHGMRHPFEYFEGIGEPVAPEDAALLTTRGERQMQSLGEHLAKKHKLPSYSCSMMTSFLSSQIITPIVFSSSVDRCVKSAKILFKSFLKKDVDVNYFKTDYGSLYFDMIEKNLNTMMAVKCPEGFPTKTIGEYINMLNYEAKSTKDTLQQKYQIVESLLTAEKNGFKLPSYANHDELEVALNIMQRPLIHGFEKLLAEEILTDMKQRLSKLPQALENFISYSVSDIHIIAISELLDLPIKHWPDYGSAFEFEISANGSVSLDRLDNLADATIVEEKAIHRLSVTELKERIDKVLAS